MKEAEGFYTAPSGAFRPDGSRKKGKSLDWSSECESFHAVDCWALDVTLVTKGTMYKLWLFKQSSGFCGTQNMVVWWDLEWDCR